MQLMFAQTFITFHGRHSSYFPIHTTLDIRYQETTGVILQDGIRDKRKTQKGQKPKIVPLKAMQKLQRCGFFAWSFLDETVCP